MNRRLVVVMPVLNCVDYTKAAIASLRCDEPFRLIVIDNGSSDSTKEYLATLSNTGPAQDTLVVRHERNTGVAASWNEGLRLAQQDPAHTAVLVTNNDVVFHPKTVDNLLAALDSHPAWGLVTAANVRGQIATAEELATVDLADEKVAPHPDFSCFMLRLSSVEHLRKVEEGSAEPIPGLFDETFSRDGRAYFEDNDYHFRLTRARIPAFSTTKAPFYHYGSVTQNQGRLPLISQQQFEANRVYYILKHGGPPGSENPDRASASAFARQNDATSRIRVLWYSDTPTCASGFGQVARNLLRLLGSTGHYDIVVLGINQYDYYDRDEFPYRIHEAMPAGDLAPQDPFGRQRLLDLLATGQFDLLFTLQDTFIMESIARAIVDLRCAIVAENQHGQTTRRTFRWIYYFPVDSHPKESWIRDAALMADYPVCYTQWGKEQCELVARNGLRSSDLKPGDLERIQVIYHGVNPHDFFPVEEDPAIDAFRTQCFGRTHDSGFLVINVNRNQPRKDLAKSLAAFSMFHQQHPDTFLYMHCQAHDVGGDLLEMARNFPNLHFMKNWGLPDTRTFRALYGIPKHALNVVYNAADVVVSTTLGEGWGLSYSEAMATKTLVIAPDNTSSREIVGQHEERGLLYACGDHPGAFVALANDNERLRPLANVTALAEQLSWAYTHRAAAAQKAARGYEWVRALSWEGDAVGRAWLEVFRRAYRDVSQPPAAGACGEYGSLGHGPGAQRDGPLRSAAMPSGR
jgi:glycosyltransferase involved in cell wall biosynthesis